MLGFWGGRFRVATLSTLEKKMAAERMDLVEELGKRKRRASIILAPYMRNTLNLLVQVREKMGLRGNPYLFAKAG